MSLRPAPMPPGAVVDGLVVQERLAQGPASATYRVTDPDIGTAFVLKEYLPEGLAQREAEDRVVPVPGRENAFARGLDRFRAEAQAAAGLDHPNLARLIRYLERNGTGYLLMPHYDGRPLHEALADWRALDASRVRAIVAGLMDAISHLHGQGLVHGDIKPDNIIVQANGSPVLLDFGAAGAAASDGARLGSDGYAAPEQYDADAEIGPPADLYGLAATLYRCFTGQRPPAAPLRSDALAAGQPDPLPPATGLLPPAEAGGLGGAIDDGLALDPAQRPASVDRWRRAFESLDWRLRVAEPPDSSAAERRERLPLALLGVLLVVMVGIAWFLFSDRDLQWPTSEQPAEQVRAPAAESPPAAEDDEERRQWLAALEADTLLGYRRFLENHPGSRFQEQAQTQIDILDERAWRTLAAEDTREAYLDYLDDFPEGLHQAEALRRIEALDLAAAQSERERAERERRDREAWDAARAEGSVEAMDRYLAAFPAGAHAGEAARIRRQLLDTLNDDRAFASATELDSLEAYQAYLDAFPRGAHVTAALAAMDRLDLRPGTIFRDCADCPEMIVVPPGAFRQGAAPDAPLALEQEKPQRAVRIERPFAVGLYEVTLAQWDACVAGGGCEETPTDNGWGRGARPVMMVSWNDAQQYLRWLSEYSGERYRLPSESEWEYFARAGEEGEWLFGDPARVCDFGNIAGTETDFGWRHEACGDRTALGTLPVGSLRPNDFGLFDVIGNVAEWTADCMNLSYLDAPNDGSAWTRGICSSHMARGGSWVTGTRDIRLPARFSLRNGDRNDFTGFRVVRDIDD